MRGGSSWFKIVPAVALFVGLLCSAAPRANAAVDMYDGSLRWTFVPYLWFPTINGTLNYTAPSPIGTAPSGTTIGVTVGPNSYLSNLNFAFFGYLEARKSNWSVFTDVITMSLSSTNSSIATVNLTGPMGHFQVSPSFNVNTSSSLSTWLVTLAGSYTVWHEDNSTLDAFLGAQYISANASTNWSLVGPLGRFPQSGTVSASQTLVDAVIGVKGTIQLGGADSHWYLPYYFDGGGGGYTTYEAMAGVAYAFSWGDVALTYRDLYIDMGGGGLVQSMSLSGPMLGVAFHW